MNDECRLQIASSPTFRREGSKKIVEDNIQFIIESLNDKSFQHYLELEGRIRDFLNFIITKSVIAKSFEGFINQGSGATSFTVLFRSYITDKMHKIDVKSSSLFDYSEVSNKFQDILNKWFQLCIEYKITIDLYFAVIYNIHSFTFNNFLMFFTALEVYHRKFMDENSKKRKKKEEFAVAIIKKLKVSNFSKNEKQKIKAHINDAKRLTFQERFEEIYDTFGDILPVLSSKIKSRNEFIRRIVDFRNDLTHGNVHPADLDRDSELFWQYRNLQLMFQLCILSKIGFGNNEIMEVYLLGETQR